MAQYDVLPLINGVTKVETDIGFIYDFVLAVIRTDTANKSMTRTQRGETDSEYIRFGDIDNKLGAQTIEGYADALAVAGEYGGGGVAVNVGSGIMQSPFELSVASALNSMTEQLEEIKFYIKSIAE